MTEQVQSAVMEDTAAALVSGEVREKVAGRWAIGPDLHNAEQQHGSLRKRPGQQILMQISGVTV